MEIRTKGVPKDPISFFIDFQDPTEIFGVLGPRDLKFYPKIQLSTIFDKCLRIFGKSDQMSSVRPHTVYLDFQDFNENFGVRGPRDLKFYPEIQLSKILNTGLEVFGNLEQGSEPFFVDSQGPYERYGVRGPRDLKFYSEIQLSKIFQKRSATDFTHSFLKNWIFIILYEYEFIVFFASVAATGC